MYILVFLALTSANKCQSVLSDEGQSLIQLLIGDYTDKKLQSITAQQLAYSGKDLNDLGHWSSCTRLKNSHYLIIDFKLTNVQTKLGLCVPKECSASDLHALITSSAYQDHPVLKSSWTPSKIKVFKPETDEASAGFYLACLVFLALILVTAYGSYIDYSLTPPKKEVSVEMGEKSSMPEVPAQPRRLPKYIILLQCFSFQRNWNSMFLRPFSDSTVIFDGIRSISILLIVFGHCLLSRITDVIYNLEDFLEYFQSPFGTILASGSASVDAFFWLTGFLIGYLILDEAARKKGRINWSMSVVARVLRLLPNYIFVLMFVNLILGNMGHGPKWEQVEDIIQLDCPKYWWTNLLFINNIYPWYIGNNCLGQSWYMAADMQLYLLSIPVIIFYLKFPKHYGWILFLTLLIISFIYRITVAAHYEVYITVINPKNNIDHYKKIHQASIARIAPYFVGIFTGFVFNYKKNGKTNDPIVKKIDLFYQSKIRSYISFAVGLLLIFLAYYFPYLAYSDKKELTGIGKGGNAAFLGFYTYLTSFSFTLMLLPTLYDQIPIVKMFLSFDVWIPIAKSSFSTYFIHLCLIRVYIASEESATMFSHLTVTTDCIFLGVVTVIAGMLLFTIVENPFGKMFKVLLTPQRQQARKEQPLLATELKEQPLE